MALLDDPTREGLLDLRREEGERPTQSARGNYRYQILRLMWDSHPWLTIATAAAGVASGLASIGVIDTINSAIHDPLSRHRLLWVFAALNIAAILTKNAASLLPSYVSLRIITALRIALCKKILDTPLEEIDRRGVPNVLALLVNDIPRLTQTLMILPTVLVESTIFVFGIAYLAYLSWLVVTLTIAAMSAGVLIYVFFFRRGMGFSRKVRDEFSTFTEYTHALLFGIKELKLNGDRRRWFRRAAIDFSSKRMARYNFIEGLWFAAGGNIEQITIATLFAFLLFGAPSFAMLDAKALNASVLAIMYVVGPLSMLVGTIPQLGDGTIACERLAEFGFRIDGGDEKILGRDHARVPKYAALRSWQSIELQQVGIDYRGYDTPTEFELGPIDLQLRSGELVFIVGGNGSGKSTLAKILTGLYSPSHGRILLDGIPVDSGNVDTYRSLFSAVFADFYLFSRVIGRGDQTSSMSRVQTYLRMLGLTDKVRIGGRQYSTTKALSNGQRKRLALLCAYMEDRPIYVLDEWAADQDPNFKKFFYEVLLPDLKSQGKSVIVITHDDQYFEIADRIVKLADGKLVSDTARHIPNDEAQAQETVERPTHAGHDGLAEENP